MKRYSILLFCCLLASSFLTEAFAQRFVRRSLERASVQAALMDAEIADTTLYPTSLSPQGELELKSIRSWVSGFFPGNLWYLYAATQDPMWLGKARRRTAALAGLADYGRTHDLGFMVGCPVGLGLKLTQDRAYRDLIVRTSETLITRFDPNVGLIRSWTNKNGKPNPYLVIIDNMMNLEMLFQASRLTGDPKFREVAVAHADKTLVQHFREDGSAYHVLAYNAGTGRVDEYRGGQGYSNTSAWARGQSWGLYGFTMCYRETGDERYLERAVRRAGYILDHPNLPSDGVPYWDFDRPGEERDASAAAVIASGLLELSGYVPQKQARRYFRAAERILRSLSSDKYLNPAGSAHGFLLAHSVGHKPKGSQVDVPIIYADYYFLEALLRYRDLKQSSTRRTMDKISEQH